MRSDSSTGIRASRPLFTYLSTSAVGCSDSMSVLCISSRANRKDGVSTTPDVSARPLRPKMSSDTLRTAVEAG